MLFMITDTNTKRKEKYYTRALMGERSFSHILFCSSIIFLFPFCFILKYNSKRNTKVHPPRPHPTPCPSKLPPRSRIGLNHLHPPYYVAVLSPS